MSGEYQILTETLDSYAILDLSSDLGKAMKTRMTNNGMTLTKPELKDLYQEGIATTFPQATMLPLQQTVDIARTEGDKWLRNYLKQSITGLKRYATLAGIIKWEDKGFSAVINYSH